MSLEVRRTNEGDRAYVADLAARTVMQSVAAVRSAEETRVRRALHELLENVEVRSHAGFVATWNGKPAGFALLIDDLPDEVTLTEQGFIAYMAVEPDLHRHGIGRALLQAAEDEARRRGLPYMALMVTEENASARALYERSGYVTERRLMCKPL